MPFRTCRTVRKCGAALCGRTIPYRNFFIAFLDELGNFKPFETYFFLVILVSKVRAAQYRTVQQSVAECGQHSVASFDGNSPRNLLKSTLGPFSILPVMVAPSQFHVAKLVILLL